MGARPRRRSRAPGVLTRQLIAGAQFVFHPATAERVRPPMLRTGRRVHIWTLNARESTCGRGHEPCIADGKQADVAASRPFDTFKAKVIS